MGAEPEELNSQQARRERPFPPFPLCTPSDFRVVLKNVNSSTMADTPQVTHQVSIEEMILQYCFIPRTKREIVEHFEYSDIKYFSKGFLKPLLESGRLQMTFPDKPSSPNQKYVAAEA
jgi:ATP-dependent DNA helicase RecG